MTMRERLARNIKVLTDKDVELVSEVVDRLLQCGLEEPDFSEEELEQLAEAHEDLRNGDFSEFEDVDYVESSISQAS